MSDISVKICGLTAPEHVRAAVDAGARYLGFNFFPKSPRFASIEKAAALAQDVPAGVAKVALTVNFTDAQIDDIVAGAPLDMLQLHGAETPERVLEVKQRYGLPVIKAIGIADAEDLAAIDLYADAADQLLIDAKPPKNSELPGGNGLPFDWRLLAERKYWRTPWMLSGGLNPENVAEAIKMTGANQVDVASGVESAPGKKDAQKIRDFIQAAH
ncbi:N-(5'-phosphoribosyl)anthranilate isomerase [Ruegeria sp. ANG-S4]|uniref:phosphoribosylanthranilate isomerase n=1 Tax=Ruegeria sp. ANG-S4 TaxID=1577904 RepID=UPI00057E2392|nr:phosphoribosylanthranilate isomerase [Ruegeria sp. ANG-S4]KIC43673.1 N-(5'-phosphoribosyl)anthranilate isomerase [Ruegeria sp. ANG-S4]